MNCLVCSSQHFSYLYNSSLKKCENCGFVTANIALSYSELKSIYTEKYFKGEEYLDYEKEKTALQYNFEKRLRNIDYQIDNSVLSNVLEIGCAYGFFAQSFSAKYPKANYLGIDVVDEAIEFGKEILRQNVQTSDYLGFSSESKFSHVFMWDVIEHLEHPELFIEKIYSDLGHDGRLYITTGDISTSLARWQKSRWRMIHPPTHLHYFSRKTLQQLLENKGFELEFVKYPPVYRSVRQIFYSLFILNKKPKHILSKIFERIPEKWLIPFNTFDIMFVCARKT